MRMARATQEDIDLALRLMKALNFASHGEFVTNDEEEQEFDIDDNEHLKRFHEEVMSLFDDAEGSLNRIIFGMKVVHDNDIFDKSLDYIALHDRFTEQQTTGDL
jgi:hypothetical protein